MLKEKQGIRLLLFCSLVSLGHGCQSSSYERPGSTIPWPEHKRHYNCSIMKDVTLDNKPATISYFGDDYHTTCTWKIPQYIQTEGYVVVLWLDENLNLPSTRNYCKAQLKFPGTEYQCQPNITKYDCWVYASRSHNCNINDLRRLLPNNNIKCENIRYWDDLKEPAVISYNASFLAAFSNQSFKIEYNPIKCSASTSPKTFSTIQPLMKHTMTIKTNLTNVTNGSGNPLSSMQNSSTIIGAVVGGFGLLLLLVAAILLWYQRQRKEANAKHSAQEKAIETTTQHPVYNNYIATTDDAGYEIPRNARQYQNLTTERQYDNLKDYAATNVENAYAN